VQLALPENKTYYQEIKDIKIISF